MVEIEVNDSITDDTELKEMAGNIAYAIADGCRNMGIVPENSETFTKLVRVSEWYQNDWVIEHVS